MCRALSLLLAAAAVPAFAVDLKSLHPQGYVSDFANVVDADSRSAIEAYAGAVEKSTGAQMSFVTLATLDGEPLEDVSIDLFRQFGVGRKNKDNGVQLLLVIDDRRSRLEVGNGLEPILPDGLDGQVLLDMRPELRAGHYGQAMLLAAQRIGETIAKAQGKTVAVPPASTALPRHEHGDGFPWTFLFFAALTILIGISSLLGRGLRGGTFGSGGFWTGMLLGSLLNGGGRSGGGFGGVNDGGSSGGFGGFGGGDAGGGGASSSW